MPDADHQAWIARAKQDLLSIKNNLAAEEIPWNAVVFHAQQAAEKYLKALLIARGAPPERTHVLTSLLVACLELDASFQELGSDCRFLDRHGMSARYPDSSGDMTEHTGRLAIEAGARICSSIQVALTSRETS